MKRITSVVVMLLLVGVVSGCATMRGEDNYHAVEFSRQPMSLPQGGCVDVLWGSSKDGKALVGIKGVSVVRVELYGDGLEYADLEQQGEWTTFTLEKGARFNFLFLHPKDGRNHYALVSEENAEVPPAWMGSGITATKDYGQGSSMTARAFQRK